MSAHARPGTATVEALARRLEALEAERAILRTLHRYGHAIDAGDEDGWVACFAPDGRFSVADSEQDGLLFDVRGRDALTTFISRHTRRPEAFHQHVVVDPLVEVAGETATCASSFLVLMRHARVPRVRAFGRYEDVLARGEDGVWRFRHRHATIDAADRSLPPIAMARGGGA
jgi:ketosteroid isomerase-like protein